MYKQTMSKMVENKQRDSVLISKMKKHLQKNKGEKS